MGAIRTTLCALLDAKPSIPPHGGHTHAATRHRAFGHVYPPAWGPYICILLRVFLLFRLSPRMGAILVCDLPSPKRNPSIPPHGGHTRNLRLRSGCFSVYPPAWGPYWLRGMFRLRATRLSPRMGAIPLAAVRALFVLPSIPPHGGHTFSIALISDSSAVYPPAWGPYTLAHFPSDLSRRLSPRMGAIPLSAVPSGFPLPSIPPHGGHTLTEKHLYIIYITKRQNCTELYGAN